MAGGQKCHDNKNIEGPGVAAREFTQLASGKGKLKRRGGGPNNWVQSVRSTHEDGHIGYILVLYSSNIYIYTHMDIYGPLYIYIHTYIQILKYICNYIIIYIYVYWVHMYRHIGDIWDRDASVIYCMGCMVGLDTGDCQFMDCDNPQYVG